ncbi:ABC transporter substrate-binding protein [Gemella cuniculi]|uniref:ABC transporter substrate-binding protein n=1 Tax=Gemella cuniculi TaxID=150240 RepID=UPI00042901E3|nr:ABC transporter substrate-binding protein [Gemella cuniculi]
MKKIITSLFAFVLLVSLTACGTTNKDNEKKELKKIDFVLDWAINTNHTGLFVAKEKGYLADVGIDLDIKPAPEDSTSDLIINNKAPFGIYYQDTMANKLSKGAGITAVAALIEHNTSGIISLKKSNITEPKDLVGKKYGTWNDPVELAMVKSLVEKQNGDFKKITLAPNTDNNSITPLENGLFDAAWIYYAWDGKLAENMNLDTNFFYLKDFSKELDYYSPIIIANNDYLKENKEEAKKVIQAIKKGYVYAIEHPEEAADILIKYAPELKEKRNFIIESQKYLSKQYATNKDRWGEFDPNRWNAFYNWVNKNNIVEKPLAENTGFTNDLIK